MKSLSNDVATLSWLRDELGVGGSTIYRFAHEGKLERFGVFRIGKQYRVSKPVALRAIHQDADDEAVAWPPTTERRLGAGVVARQSKARS
jgi:hypothetical protein